MALIGGPIDGTALAALRLSDAMREMILHPVDRTFGGDAVVCRWPRRTNYALGARGIIDASDRLTPFGVQVQRALLRRTRERKRMGLRP